MLIGTYLTIGGNVSLVAFVKKAVFGTFYFVMTSLLILILFTD